MFTNVTQRLRNVNPFQAGSILYGDWGTSKAYVIGLAFALAGYSSFWLILGVCVIMALVGMNYIKICELYPNGGGVYASVRHRSKTLSLMGAFFLIADYLVTAALSALSAFSYLGMPNPLYYALVSILVIGALNFLGPRYTGNLAFIIVIPVLIAVIILGVLCIPELPNAIHNLRPLHGGFLVNWSNFTVVIVALSGIESIANITGVMTLDKDSTPAKPKVKRTATLAILWVMLEVCFFTALFGLAVNALPGLTINNREVYSPDQIPIRDYMLKYMGEVFGTEKVGPAFGNAFGIFVSIAFAALLLSAVNTALVALTSLLFVMAKDREMPAQFTLLNSFGVPMVPLALGTFATFGLLCAVTDIVSLADLYAVGFVGAIVTNLGSTSTDPSIDLAKRWRISMFATFLVLAAIEITLLITKPHARAFAIYVFAIGLFLRNIVSEIRGKERAQAIEERKKAALTPKPEEPASAEFPSGGYLCAIRNIGKTVDFAIEEAKNNHKPLCVLYIREQKFLSEADTKLSWMEDEHAKAAYNYVKAKGHDLKICFRFVVSDSTAVSISNIARELKVSRVILGAPRRTNFYYILYGNTSREVRKIMPDEIELLLVQI